MIKSIKDYSLEIVIGILLAIVALLGVYLMCASCDREPPMTLDEIDALQEEVK